MWTTILKIFGFNAEKYILVGIVLLAVTGAFGWYTYHERSLGKQEILRVQKVETDKRAAAVAKVEANEDTKVRDLGNQLAKALDTPPRPAVVVRMCLGSPGTIATVRADVGSSGAGHAESAPSGGMGSGNQGATDIAPFTESILQRDEALINTLQTYVRECQRIGACKK